MRKGEEMNAVIHSRMATELGEMTYVVNRDGLIDAFLDGQAGIPAAERLGVEVPLAANPVAHAAHSQLVQYLAGTRTSFDLPVATYGDPFQERVWSMLREIPYGDTATYGQLAERIGDRALAQRVGRAVARNPLLIVIPCHRVIGATGELVGFSAGLERKERLLTIEGRRFSNGRIFPKVRVAL